MENSLNPDLPIPYGVIEKHDSVYQDGVVVVSEYPTQDFLAAAYLQAKQEGLLSMFFHEHMEPPSLVEFLEWAMEKDSVLYGAFARAGKRLDPIGFGKLSVTKPCGAGRNKAEVKMLFFRGYQIRSLTIPACRLMLSLIFDRRPVDVVYGSIPEHNRASLRFMRAIGFGSMAQPIPHYTSWQGQECGMCISWMSKEMWSLAISP